MAAFSWLREMNMVKSLGPLAAASTGDASPTDPLKKLVASLAPGRFTNGGLAAGGVATGVREKNGSSGGATGVDDIPPRNGSDAAGAGGGTETGSKNDGRELGLGSSGLAPGCDPFAGPDEISPNNFVNDPAAGPNSCGGGGIGSCARSMSAGPNMRVKSPTCF
jgi:hypothetical protein